MHISRIRTALALGVLLMASGPAFAGWASNGNILTIISQRQGVLMFTQSGTRNTPPACATVPSRWAVNVTTVSGQATAATILTAYSLGKQVYVAGTNDCTVWADTETVEYVNTVN